MTTTGAVARRTLPQARAQITGWATGTIAHPDGHAAHLFPATAHGHLPQAHPAETTRPKNVEPQHTTPGAAARRMIDHNYAAHLCSDHAGGQALVQRDARRGFRARRAAPHTGGFGLLRTL